MSVDVLDKSVGIFAHLEEVSLFFSRLNLSAAVGALAVNKLRLREEALARCAVKSLVISLIDVALVIELLENLLNLTLVVVVCCSDELIVACVHDIPVSLDDACNVIDILLRSYACCVSLFLNFLTMLVCSCLEENIIALKTLVSCD